MIDKFAVSNFGFDPEFFVINNKKKIVPSAALGEQWINPHYVERVQNGCWHRDGAVLEWSGYHSSCRDTLIPALGLAIQSLLKKYENFSLDNRAYYEFTKTDLTKMTEDMLVFGCAPDFSGYTKLEQSPTLPEGFRGRVAGGHLHLSWWNSNPTSKKQTYESMLIAREELPFLVDYFVGMPLVAILGDDVGAEERARREFYGKAGSVRYPGWERIENDYRQKSRPISVPMRLEYRVPSARIFHHPVLMHWGLGSIGSAVSYLGELKELEKIVDLQTLQRIINTHDVVAARGATWEMVQRLTGKSATVLQDLFQSFTRPNTVVNGGNVSPLYTQYNLAMAYVWQKAAQAGYGWIQEGSFLDNWGYSRGAAVRHHFYPGVQVFAAGGTANTSSIGAWFAKNRNLFPWANIGTFKQQFASDTYDWARSGPNAWNSAICKVRRVNRTEYGG